MDFSSILAYILTLLITALAGAAVELVRRKIGVEGMRQISLALEQKRTLALLAVQFVEQVYWDYAGEAKLAKASEWLAARAAEHGIKLTADEIQGLIESALRQMKDQFGTTWGKAIA